MSDDFESRLESAISRGRQRAGQHASEERQKELTEEEKRRLHTTHRLALSERIEKAIQRVADHFPGFRQESMYGEVGWGAATEQLNRDHSVKHSVYSRLCVVCSVW